MRLIAPVVTAVWLLLSAFPSLKPWLDVLPQQVSAPATKLLGLAPPAIGLRFVFFCISCVLAIALWYRSRTLEATHDRLLGGVKEWNDLTGED